MKALRDRTFALLAGQLDVSALQHAWDEIVSSWNEARAQRLFFDGVERTVDLTTSDLPVYHGLNRIPARCWAVMQNANATIYTITQHPTPRTHIFVRASAAVRATLVIT
jgi:hypothetical protein